MLAVAGGQCITRNGQMDNGGSKDRARKWLAAASRNAKGFAFAEPEGSRPGVIEAVGRAELLTRIKRRSSRDLQANQQTVYTVEIGWRGCPT